MEKDRDESSVSDETQDKTQPAAQEDTQTTAQDETQPAAQESAQATEKKLPPSRSMTWLPEGLAIAAVMLDGAALLGPRVTQTLGAVGATSQAGALARIVITDGATALLGAILAVVALVSARKVPRSWARPLSVAALIVSVAIIVVAAVTFGMVPEPQPQPPVAPGLGQ